MLRILTDSHVPPDIALAVRKIVPLSLTPLREWHVGNYLHAEDPQLLQLAWEERLTILIYDVNSFPLHVKDRIESGAQHAGVIYVPPSFGQNAIGPIARALVKVWKTKGQEDWTNRIHFLAK